MGLDKATWEGQSLQQITRMRSPFLQQQWGQTLGSDESLTPYDHLWRRHTALPFAEELSAER